MFFIRAVFWLTLVIAFIPVSPEDLTEGQRSVSTGETLEAARTVVSDLSGFCERNPATCGTGREIFSQLGAKAKTGARFVYSYLDSKQERDTDAVQTGSVIQ